MAREPLWHWNGHEYPFEEKGADWYWALGIIALAAIIAAALFSNIILALVIATAAGTLALQAAKHPREHYFAITDRGVVIDRNLYRYEDMLSFSVLEYADESLPPSLSIKTKNFLSPHILIPIVDHDPVEIYEFFLSHLPEGGHDESFFDRLIEMLRL
jgi:hypothetical protein